MRRVAIAIDLDWPVPHHQAVAAGALRVGRSRGWRCEIDPFVGFPGHGSRYDGVIGRITPELASWATRTGTPAVNVWINSPVRRFPLVTMDFKAAGMLVARHFQDRGLRRLGFLGREDDEAARRLFHGFRPDDALFVPADPQDAKGWLRLQRPLARWVKSLTPPIGVLASVDILGRHLIHACLGAGLRIPDDVAVIGAGNTALVCDLLEPTLSSLEYGFERVGRRAAALLERLMTGRKAPRGETLVPPSGILARRSSDAFAVGDPAVASALRSIWTRSERPLSVDSLLDAIPLSRRTLERRFQKELGRTVHDEIRRAHLERSKRLLVETREPLKSIALRSGFRDPQQFSRVFRAIEGRTPQEYRRGHSDR